MSPIVRILIGGCVLMLVSNSVALAEDGTLQALWERVFGDAVKLNPDTVAKVKKLPPGERLYIDRDGDGRNDEVWFIDTARRHRDERRPILVRVIDEDGDLDEHQGPDLDSDLYVVDWHADGKVDVVLDYHDDDGDGDVDEMAFYFPRGRGLGVWWSRDNGDDNLLWYDVDYTYYQALCQWKCHFSGDETFVSFGLTKDTDEWLSSWENPFLFYDPDGDTCSEIVLRISGRNDIVRSARYSFDVDDDAYGRRTHDYEFSLTCVTEKDAPLRLQPDIVRNTTVRGIPTQPWLKREEAQPFTINAKWSKICLTWHELNANTSGDPYGEPYERWEGIINNGAANANFPQVGGPSCSPNNTRHENALSPKPPLQLYYDPTDQRLHLMGANEGWIHVDYNHDGKVDARYLYADENGDGILDRRQIDLDADGQFDFDWPMMAGKPEPLDLELDTLTRVYRQNLRSSLDDSQHFIDAAKAVLEVSEPSDIERFFDERLPSWVPQTRLGEYIRKTDGGARLYVELVRDRLLGRLKERFGGHTRWERFESLYAQGDYRSATGLLTQEIAPIKAPSGVAFKDYTRRIPLQISNTSQDRRINWPISLAVDAIRRKAPDFNPARCAVVAGDRRLAWRQLPHQVDTLDPESGAELSFLVDVEANAGTTVFLYYHPAGQAAADFPPKTATLSDWVPPNIGWESNIIAYRTYYGVFDFFGKKIEKLIYPGFGNQNYHQECEWGIDALHVGNTAGLGGLTLYLDGKEWPAHDPTTKRELTFGKRVLVSGPVRTALEITVGNIIPDRPEVGVRFVCLIYAERQEAEIRAFVSGGGSDMQIAPGLLKLPREDAFTDSATGCLGVWGFQQIAIDEIGLALIVPPERWLDVAEVDIPKEPGERRIRCSAGTDSELRYWIIGDWRRGRQHPIAPTIENWRREVTDLAKRLHHPPSAAVGSVQEVPF